MTALFIPLLRVPLPPLHLLLRFHHLLHNSAARYLRLVRSPLSATGNLSQDLRSPAQLVALELNANLLSKRPGHPSTTSTKSVFLMSHTFLSDCPLYRILPLVANYPTAPSSTSSKLHRLPSACTSAVLHLILFSRSTTSISQSPDRQTIFIPAKQPESKQSPLPKDLARLLEAFFVQSGILDSFSRPRMDYTGKNLEVVDIGGEVDYSGHQWFQEPPPRPEVRIICSWMDLD